MSGQPLLSWRLRFPLCFQPPGGLRFGSSAGRFESKTKMWEALLRQSATATAVVYLALPRPASRFQKYSLLLRIVLRSQELILHILYSGFCRNIVKVQLRKGLEDIFSNLARFLSTVLPSPLKPPGGLYNLMAIAFSPRCFATKKMC